MKITLTLLKPLINLVISFLIRLLEQVAKETQTEYDDMLVEFLKEALPIIQDIVNEISQE
jgi:hypothetical protein